MGKNRLKTVTAGQLVYAVCYSQATAADEHHERQAKAKMSSAARQLLNFRAAWQRLELILAANFGRRDLFVTLTYDNDHLPKDRKAAQRELGKFWRALRQQMARRGGELRYVYTTEEMPDEPGGERRLHHHAVVSCRARDAETLQALWGRGYVHAEELLDGPNDSYEARARYLIKERHPGAYGRKTGLRGWSSSKNLRKPEVTSVVVPDTVTITPPPGAYVLDRRGEANSFGSYTYLKYLLPEPKRKRKRRDNP